MNLRNSARDRDCTIRLPDVCNFDRTTTVLAHVRMSGISGAGMKAPDLLGAWACSNCHDAVDRRRYLDIDRDYVRLAHLEGVMRTQAQLLEEGAIHIGQTREVA